MRTGRGFERLVNFTDAVVAIALTLLVLPLVEIAGAIGEDETAGEVLVDHVGELTAFLVSFLVIFLLWLAHHRTMENFRGYDELLMWLHLLWLLTVVLLPFTTQLLSTDAYSRGAVPLYVGTLLLSAIALTGISFRGRHSPELLHADRPEVQRWLAEPESYFTLGVMLLTFLLCLVFPQVGTAPLILLLFQRPFELLLGKLRRRPPRDVEM